MINNRQAMSLETDREVRRAACMSVARETTGKHVDDPVPQENVCVRNKSDNTQVQGGCEFALNKLTETMRREKTIERS